MELMRGVRSQFMELIAGLDPPNLATMSLDVVDSLTIEAAGYLVDLDQALNTYAMRVKTKYGQDLPELTNIVKDNISYAKAVKLMGYRSNVADLDFCAMTSMGTAVSDLDLRNIKDLRHQVLSVAEYGFQQFSLLKNRMNTIAPNLTALVGVLIAARLIVCGGSLLNLAKMPRNKIQMRHVPPKHKLTISRTLAAKTVLAIRYDALGDGQDKSIGSQYRLQVKVHIRNLGRKKGAGARITTAKVYNSIKKMKHEAEEKKEHAEVVVESIAEKEEELEEAGGKAPINGEKKGEEEDD
ncbi:hypothetical protein Vadar_019782 [Vaccinium darrowii]|uniref:Uncharacterized protein n=1 Tax=Vaccinium darrowii TaxID=229202 RepID=A0ACB7YGS8_9ERIC|nr:hypothetical protein Vadar_019782 [Vaccinium darrowii]